MARMESPRARAAAFLLIFLAAILLYTAHNDFPLGYHPDEETKVRLVVEGGNLFYHPLALLQPVRLALALGAPDSPEAVVRLGRTVSALYAAGAVLGFMGTAWLLRGAMAGLSVGLLTALCAPLLARAHYFKEDTALLFGLAMSFWALAWFMKNRADWRRALLLGAACGLALSGKYIGVVAPVLCLPFVLWPGARRPAWQRLALFLGAFAATLAFVNYPALLDFGDFLGGLRHEQRHVLTHHQGVRARRFGLYYPVVLMHEIPWPIALGALAHVVYGIATWRRRGAVERLLLIFLFGWYALVAAFSVQAPRYVLPIVVWAHYAAGMAVAALWRRGRADRHGRLSPALRWFAALLLAALVLRQTGLCIDYARQFGNDSRRRAAVWAWQHLPSGTRLAYDRYCQFDFQTLERLMRRRGPLYEKRMESVGEFGSLAQARKDGATHVAVCGLTYERYFEPGLRADPGESIYPRRRGFYEELFRRGELLWEVRPRHNIRAFTNPVVRIYSIEGIAPPAQPEAP